MSAAHTPDRGRGQALTGPGDLGVPQEVGIDPTLRRPAAGARPTADGRQPHDAHRPLHQLPVHHDLPPVQPGQHAAQPIGGGSPGTSGPSHPSGPSHLQRTPWDGSRYRSDSPPAGRTGALSATSGGPGPPSPAASTDSWTGPLRQEIPFHLQLADLLLQPGDKGGVVLGLLFLAVAEDAGGSFGDGFLPSLNLAGMNFVPGGQLGHRLIALHRSRACPADARATLALKAGLCFLRSLDISHSFPTATAALSLGAELWLAQLSSFPGPPQRVLKRSGQIFQLANDEAASTARVNSVCHWYFCASRSRSHGEAKCSAVTWTVASNTDTNASPDWDLSCFR